MNSRLISFGILLLIAFEGFQCVSGRKPTLPLPLDEDECPTAPSTPGDRRTDKSTLKVATYNTEWLFLDRSNCPGDGCKWSTESEAVQHLMTLAGEVEFINADILVLQEVQDCTVLRDLITYLPSNNGYVPYLIKGTDTATGQNVALLTRIDPSMDLTRSDDRAEYPVTGSQCYSDSLESGPTEVDTTGVSKHFYTIINVNQVRVLLIGLHLLAFPTVDYRCSQREGQAAVVQSIVSSLQGQFDEVIIAGDMNDYSSTSVDSAGDIPTSRVLSMLGNPTTSVSMTAAASFMPQPQRYSSWYDINDSCQDDGGKENTMIDHLLVSSGLATQVSSAYFVRNYNASCYEYFSDHWPLVAVLRTPTA